MIINDVVCPFCGCLCDDLDVDVQDGRIVRVDNACTLGSTTMVGDTRLKAPIRRDGNCRVETTYDAAIDEAAQILLGADRPVLYGWSSTHGEAQSLGVHLAELIGGVIDSTTSV